MSDAAQKVATAITHALIRTFEQRGLVACRRTNDPTIGPVIVPAPEAFAKMAGDFGRAVVATLVSNILADAKPKPDPEPKTG